jgi:predicted PurR-regulated permease PerM
VLLLLLLAFLVAGFSLLSAPASDWVRRIPESFEKVEAKLRSMADRANKISKAAETVEKLTETEGQTELPQVELKRPGVLNSLWSSAKGMVVLAVEVFVLLYFFLAAGEVFTLKLIQILPRLQDKKRAVEIARETEKGISRYLGAMTLVNLFEGTAIGLGLWLIGMPNPLLWGVMAFFANYIPYIGAIVAATIVTAAALISFDSVGYALLAPAIYLGVNFMDNFISPYVMGRRLVLNPVIVFLAVMFWGWLWGIIGVLLAVPITVMFKILCDHIPALAPYGEFLTAPRKPKPECETAKEPTFAQDKS